MWFHLNDHNTIEFNPQNEKFSLLPLSEAHNWCLLSIANTVKEIETGGEY